MRGKTSKERERGRDPAGITQEEDERKEEEERGRGKRGGKRTVMERRHCGEERGKARGREEGRHREILWDGRGNIAAKGKEMI